MPIWWNNPNIDDRIEAMKEKIQFKLEYGDELKNPIAADCIYRAMGLDKDYFDGVDKKFVEDSVANYSGDIPFPVYNSGDFGSLVKDPYLRGHFGVDTMDMLSVRTYKMRKKYPKSLMCLTSNTKLSTIFDLWKNITQEDEKKAKKKEKSNHNAKSKENGKENKKKKGKKKSSNTSNSSMMLVGNYCWQNMLHSEQVEAFKTAAQKANDLPRLMETFLNRDFKANRHVLRRCLDYPTRKRFKQDMMAQTGYNSEVLSRFFTYWAKYYNQYELNLTNGALKYLKSIGKTGNGIEKQVVDRENIEDVQKVMNDLSNLSREEGWNGSGYPSNIIEMHKYFSGWETFDNLKDFWDYYDVFLKCALHGLFYFGDTPAVKTADLPEDSMLVYIDNPHLDDTFRVFYGLGKNKADRETLADIKKRWGHRFREITEYLEVEDSAESVYAKIREANGFDREIDDELSIWDTIGKSEEKKFIEYRNMIKQNFYTYMIEFVGGIQHFMTNLMHYDDFKWNANFLRGDRFRSFFELEYFISRYWSIIKRKRSNMDNVIEYFMKIYTNIVAWDMDFSVLEQALSLFEDVKSRIHIGSFFEQKWTELADECKKRNQGPVVNILVAMKEKIHYLKAVSNHYEFHDFINFMNEHVFPHFMKHIEEFMVIPAKIRYYLRTCYIDVPLDMPDLYYQEFKVAEPKIRAKNVDWFFDIKQEAMIRNRVGKQGYPGKSYATYRVGLKMPKEIRREYNKIMREREVLRYLIKRTRSRNGQKSADDYIKNYRKFHENTRTEIKKIYERLINKFITKSLNELKTLLNENTKQLKPYHAKNLDNSIVERDDLKPTDQDGFIPNISIHDYKLLANESLKLKCKETNEIAQIVVPSVIDKLKNKPVGEKKIEHTDVRKHIKKTNEIEKPGSMIAQWYYNLVPGVVEAYDDLCGKLEKFKKIITKSTDTYDFTDCIETYLLSYSIPKPLTSFLSYHLKSGKEKLESQWIMNTLVGWRRKVDPFLPEKYQVESITEWMQNIADQYLKLCETESEEQIVRNLQKNQVLHLFHLKTDLSMFFNGTLKGEYESFHRRIRKNKYRPETDDKPLSSFKYDEIRKAADILIERVKKYQERFDPTDGDYQKCETYIHKVESILSNLGILRFAWKRYLPGSIYTKSLSKIFKLNQKGADRRYNFKTAIRGIMAVAYAQKYMKDASVEFETNFTPQKIITVPFTSKKRKKTLLPLKPQGNRDIISIKKHPNDVWTRKNGEKAQKTLNSISVTEVFRKRKPVYAGINVYNKAPNNPNSKGKLWFEIHPTRKMLECIDRGAFVKEFRFIPNGPARRIDVDIIFAALHPNAFMHSGRFIKEWLKTKYRFPNFPVSDYICLDINTISKNTIAVGVPDEEIDISNSLILGNRHASTKRRIREDYRRQIARMQEKISNGATNAARLKSEIALLHRRIRSLRKQRRFELIMLYLFAGKCINAKYFGWDGIRGISTHGNSGRFADVITNMPKDKNMYGEFVRWAEDLKRQQILPSYKETKLVSPYTSSICPSCYTNDIKNGEFHRTRDKNTDYDVFRCTAEGCGYESHNRHACSARVGAIELRHLVENVL